MLKKFYPKDYVKSAYFIDYKKLYYEGYRGIIFDIDNTLVEHGKKINKNCLQLINQLRIIGFKIILLSNNKKERVKSFATSLNVDYIYKAHKPSSKNYLKACKQLGLEKHKVIFIGDQIFTDIYGANNANIYNILTEPINKKEEIQIILKRFLEKPILYFYKKSLKNPDQRLS